MAWVCNDRGQSFDWTWGFLGSHFHSPLPLDRSGMQEQRNASRMPRVLIVFFPAGPVVALLTPQPWKRRVSGSFAVLISCALNLEPGTFVAHHTFSGKHSSPTRTVEPVSCYTLDSAASDIQGNVFREDTDSWADVEMGGKRQRVQWISTGRSFIWDTRRDSVRSGRITRNMLTNRTGTRTTPPCKQCKQSVLDIW